MSSRNERNVVPLNLECKLGFTKRIDFPSACLSE
jgi:hypothetical protein